MTGKESYIYDGHGRRVQITKTSDGSINYPLYSLDGKLILEDNRQTLQRIEYIFAGGRLVAKKIQPITAAGVNNGTASTTTIHTDFLGSPVAETSSTGTVTRVERYTPYGEPSDMQLDAGPGFTGHATDVATGLTYMQQRYYDAEIGRFLSPDPVGPEEDFIKHFNRYVYAYNNPVRYTDPDGRCPSCIGAAVGVGLEILVQGAEIAAGSRNSFDGGRVLVSGLAGATGVGTAQLINRGARLGTLAKATLSRVSDAGVSAGSQLAKDGDISLTATAIDVVAGATVGRLVGDAAASKAANSSTGRVLARQADRTARIAAQNTRAAKQTAAESARAAQVGHTTGAAAASGTSAANAASSAANTGCVIAKGKSC